MESRWSDTSARPRERTDRELLSRALVLFAIGFGLFLYLTHLDATPIQQGNEAMYTFPAIHMLQTGDFLVPQYEHGPFLEKPPLTWWILAASYKLFGISVFAARLPSALAAIATILLAGLWAKKRGGMAAGLFAALALTYTFKFAAFTRESAADTFLTLAVTLAVIATDRAVRRQDLDDRAAGFLAGASLVLAFGFKGLIGLALPLGGVAFGALLDRTRPVRPWRRGAFAALAFVTLTGPWHWAMTERLGLEFWKAFYWENQFVRGATHAFMATHRGPFYYLGVLAWSSFPWVLFLVLALRKNPRRSSAPIGWLVFGLLFLSALLMKREVYVMPLFPPMAILVGEFLGQAKGKSRSSEQYAWLLASIAVVVGLVLWGRMMWVLPSLAGWDAYILLGLALALLLTALLIAFTKTGQTWGPAGVGLACGVLFLSILLIEGRTSRYDPVPDWGERVREECAGHCQGYLLRVRCSSINHYARWEWKGPILDPRKLLRRPGNQETFLVLRTRHERLVKKLPLGVEVLDRRPWLEQNWAAVALHPNRPALESLSLLRIHASRSEPSPEGREDLNATLFQEEIALLRDMRIKPN